MASPTRDVNYNNFMADGAFTMTRDEQIAYIMIGARPGKRAIEIHNVLEKNLVRISTGRQIFQTMGLKIQQWTNDC